MARKIDFQLGFTVDKAQLTELQQVLKQIQKDAESATGTGSIATQLSKASVEAEKLERILNQSWNGKLNQLDVSKFTDQIKKGYGSVEQLKKSFESVGRGDVFNKVQASVAGANLQLKQSNKLLDDMAQTMSNTVRFGLASSVFNRLSDGLQSAYNYSIKLNSSLNDIRIVSDKSAEDMERFAVQANEAAKALGASTLDYTKASTIYYQQGLGDEETAARTETTIKAANVTGQTGDEVSEQLTAIWNGYKVSAEESEMYIDKVAKVAAATAADLEELSTGMSKTASAANAMGVDFDNLNAMLATVISVTREAPETIGTSFRSIFSRMSQLEADGTDEFGVTLSKVTEKMQSMGVEILDQNGELKDMDDILSDVASKWNDWSKGQQVAAARVMAGTQQYSRFIALMDNQDMWNQALEDSKNSLGELDRENNIYLESTKAHLQQLSTEAEKTYNLIFDQDVVVSFTDSLTGALSVFNNFLETTGGGMTSLLTLGSMLGNLFNKQIGAGISKSLQNTQIGYQNEQDLLKIQGITNTKASMQGPSDLEAQVYEEIRTKTQEILNISKGLTTEQYNQLKALREQALEANLLKAQLDDQKDKFTDMNQINADLKIQNQRIKEQKTGYEKIRKAIQDINAIKDSKTIYPEDREDALDHQYTILKEIEKLAQQKLLTDEQGATYEKALDRDGKNRLLTKQQLQKLDNMANDALAKEVEREKELTKEKQLQQMLDEQQDIDVNRNAEQSMQDLDRGILTEKNTQDIQSAVNGMTTLITLVSSTVGIIQTLTDESLSGWEKFERIISTLIMTIPTFISGAEDLAALPLTLSAVKAQLDATTISVIGLKLSMWELMLIIAAIAAVIGTAVLIGQQLSKAYNADADAAREAKQSVEELSTAYEECKQKVEDLKDAMSQYDEAADALEGLKENTDEFKEALEKANEEARKLIEKYNLFDSYSYDSKGLIKIDKTALDNALKEAETESSKVRDSLLLAQMGASQADLKSQRTNYSRKVGMLTYASKDNVYIKGTTANSGERRTESVQLDDNSVSAIVNGLIQIREDDRNKYEDLFKENNKEDLKNKILAFDDITPAIKANIDQIMEQTDALKSLTESTSEAAEKMGYISGQIIDGIVEDKYSKQFENFATKGGKTNQALVENLQNAMSTLIKNNQNNGLQNKIEEASAKAQSVKSTGALQDYYPDIKNDVDLIRTYAAEIKGIDWDTINNHTIVKDGIGKSTMKTDEGKVLIEDKNDEQMRKELAAKKAVDNIKAEYEKDNKEFNDNLAQSLQNLATKASEFGSKYGTDFSSAMLASIANGTHKFDFSDLFSQIIDPDAVPEMLNMSAEDLMSKLELSEEDLARFGFTGEKAAENFKEAWNAGFEGYEWDMDTALSAAMEKRDSEIDSLGLSKKKTQEYKDEIQDYGTHIMRIAKDSEVFADSLDKDAESAIVAAQSIIEMNKGIDALADGFEEWADVLKKSSKESQEYAEALGGIQDALSLIYGVEADYISNDFVISHLKEIEQAANGSETAIEGLRQELTEDIILNIAVYNGLDSSVQNDLLNMIHSLEAQIPDIKVGTEIDMDDETYAGFLQTMQDIINTAGLTADQANALFSTMGFDTNFATTEESMPQDVPEYVTDTIIEEKSQTEDGKPLTKTRTRTYQDGVFHTEGKMTVMAMATSADGTKVPQIKSVTKKGTGAQNNYSSKNKGGKSPGSSSKKSGGGSGNKKDPNTEKHVESKKDPYHDIDIKIKNVSKDLEKLQNQQSKFFGQSLINNLNKQYELLGKQIDLTKQKIQIARQEQARLANELSQKGVAFNTDGTISNYAAAYDAQLNYVNSLIDKYNAMSADEQEKYKDTLDKAKEDFNKFTENISEYDKTVTDTIPELEKDIQDAIDKQIEINIEKFNMEIKIRLDLKEAELEWNKFKKKIIDGIKDEDILGTAQARLRDFDAYYKNDNTGIIQAGTKQVTNILSELTKMDNIGWSDVYGDNRQQALEDLQTYYKQLISDLEEVAEIQEDIHQAYLDMLDEAQDKFDEQINTYEQITKLIEHDTNLIQLVYGDESYSKLTEFYEKQQENYNKQLDFQRQQKDFWYQQMLTAKEGTEEWEKARDNWMQAVDDWRSLVEDAVQNITDKYVNAINKIFQELNNQVTNGKGLDYIDEQWTLINKNADQYLDTINSMYGIQKLENKYLDAIDKTDSVSAQRKLNDLMKQEVAALEEKDKLTQYDVDRANKKYEIALKQIALEEAQQNKSTMRLRRDSQGNYSYQFVSDQDEIGNLKDELQDLYNQLYNFDLDAYKENLDSLLSAWTEYQEKMAEAAQINDPVQRAEKEALIQEQYGDLINGLVEQNETLRLNLHESAFTELADLYDIDVSNFQKMTDDEKDILLGDMIPYWTSGVQDMAKVFADDEEGFTGVCKKALEDLDEATKDYTDSLEEVEQVGDISFDTIANGTDQAIDKTEALLQNNRDLIDNYYKQIDAIRSVAAEVDKLITKYDMARQAAIAASEAAYRYQQEQNRRAAEAAAREQAKNSNSSNSNNSNNRNNGSGGGNGNRGSGSGDGVLSVGDTCTYTGGTYYYDSYGTTPAGSRGPGKQVTVTQVKTDGRPYPIHVKSSDSAYGWLKKSQLSGFDTGGYTGDWGDNSGRLALLHAKEIVLNKEDTPNLLNAVKILRTISNNIGTNFLSQMTGIKVPTAENNETLEQNVHIDATFPDVKDSKEIQDAFNNLVNIASQRALRNKR